MRRVFLIEPDSNALARLVEHLGEDVEAEPYDSLDAFLDGAVSGHPPLVVFGPSFANAKGLGAIEDLLHERPQAAVILTVAKLSTTLLQQSLRIGVRDVVQVESEEGADVTAAAQQLEDAIQRVGRALESVKSVESVAPSEPSEPAMQHRPERGFESRVVTVMSTKGGSGKSVVATNLAVLLAQRTSRPVVLVDANLQFGDVAVMLRIAPEQTVLDAAQNIHQLDEGMLRSQLQRHGPSGLWVLPAPVEPAMADDVAPADLIKVIEVLRGFCAYVVIDTPGYFNDVVLSVLEHSNEILFVSGLDIPNIKNVKLGLQVLNHLSLKARVRLVLNRSNSKVKLDVGEVLRTLQLQASALIPSEISVPQSVNKGVPVVLDAPKSDAAKALRALADLFIKDPAASLGTPSSRGRGMRGRIER